MHHSPGKVHEHVESLLRVFFLWLRLVIECAAGLTVAVGLVAAVTRLWRRRPELLVDTAIRLTLARHLAVALELQLAADVVSTAMAPTWGDIGRMAAIAVVRTLLNFFLNRELETHRRELHEVKAPAESGPAPPAQA